MGHIYKPLMFHLRNFFDSMGHYKKHLHSSFYFKPGLGTKDFKNYLVADFDYYVSRIHHIMDTYEMDKCYDYPYLRDVMPKMLYDFGYHIGSIRRNLNANNILLYEYHALYDPFQKQMFEKFPHIKDYNIA